MIDILDSENSIVIINKFSSIPVEDDSDIGSPGVDGPPIMPGTICLTLMDCLSVSTIRHDLPTWPRGAAVPPPLRLCSCADVPCVSYQEDEITHCDRGVATLPAAASPTADSPGYVPESDPEEEPEEDDEDPEEDPADYPADRDNDDDEEEEEPSEMMPMMRMRTGRRKRRRRSTQLRPTLSHLLPTSSPHLQLLSSDHMTDRPDITLPPQKRLCIDLGPRYEIGESSAAAATRPIGGRRADYGFVGTMDTKIRRQRAKEVGYGIIDVWVDPREAIEEVAPMTLEGVNVGD
ncbi:hypothetical protein Tco_1105608 [Tanacetum coccineum]